LFGRGFCESDVDQPTALVVEDIGTDLADLFGSSVAVEVVVLHLEVLSHGDEDVEGFLEGRRRSDTRHVKGESDGEVEGVVSGLVDNDEVVPARQLKVSIGLRTRGVSEYVLFKGEFAEVDGIFRSGDEINELTELGLEGSLCEEDSMSFQLEATLEKKGELTSWKSSIKST
jgi:hypothetical protein